VAWHVPRRRQRVRDIIDAGQAALVIVGESTLQQAVDKAGLSEKHVAKELDVSAKDVAPSRSRHRSQLTCRFPGQGMAISPARRGTAGTWDA
jgi:hypothetical protein